MNGEMNGEMNGTMNGTMNRTMNGTMNRTMNGTKLTPTRNGSRGSGRRRRGRLATALKVTVAKLVE